MAAAGLAAGMAAVDGEPFGGLAALVMSSTSFSRLIPPSPSSDGDARAEAFIPSVASGAATAESAEALGFGGVGDVDADALGWEGDAL